MLFHESMNRSIAYFISYSIHAAVLPTKQLPYKLWVNNSQQYKIRKKSRGKTEHNAINITDADFCRLSSFATNFWMTTRKNLWNFGRRNRVPSVEGNSRQSNQFATWKLLHGIIANISPTKKTTSILKYIYLYSYWKTKLSATNFVI